MSATKNQADQSANRPAEEIVRDLGAALNDLNRARSEVERLERLTDELDAELAAAQFGVRVGAVVRDEKGREFRVTRLERVTWSAKVLWLHGNQRLKGGGFGVRERLIGFVVRERLIGGEWEVVG